MQVNSPDSPNLGFMAAAEGTPNEGGGYIRDAQRSHHCQKKEAAGTMERPCVCATTAGAMLYHRLRTAKTSSTTCRHIVVSIRITYCIAIVVVYYIDYVCK